MLPINAFLLFLSLAAAAFEEQQTISNSHKSEAYNITLNFDELPTNSSGVGFHPIDPKQDAFSYKGVYLQSFTLLNASSANLTRLDKTCSRSWPNAIFGSRREGYPWPRISLHDLSKPKHEVAEDIRKSDRTFSLASLHMKATGNITGSQENTIGLIDFTMMRLDPDPRKEPIPPEAGYPGLGRGVPFPLYIGNVTGFSVYFPAGAHEGFTLNLKQIFGDDFGTGVDVIEVTSQIYRKAEKTPYFEPAEDWEVCLDDIVLDIAEKDSSKPVVPGEVYLGGIKAGGSMVGSEDIEWQLRPRKSYGAGVFSF